jgi:7-cyano-7-deazaguanine synthase in queuosine biosynthesis
MTSFRLRSARDQPVPRERDALLLDWFTDRHRQRSTIQANADFLTGLQPTPAARDLFRLSGAVYCADKLALRSEAADAWTRELELDAPAVGVMRWRRAALAFADALSFLSGDHWALTFRTGPADADRRTTEPLPDCVCLFSGGLDSLAGAIDLLEAGGNVLLVGHFESGFVGGLQAKLFASLKRVYGDRVRLRRLRLGPAAENRLQHRSLPKERENTTRARSFLFIGAGLAVASAFGEDVPLCIPENGFIGINVPLVASRSGSLSTRTTHPHFIARLGDALAELGIANPLENPFRLMTKGEALAASANPQLIAAMLSNAISCAHPEDARWERQPPSSCGYCFPCLIRRASLHRLGLDDANGYRRDALGDDDLLAEESDRGASLRALVRGLARSPRPTDVLRNGSVPAVDAAAFAEVNQRGREELAVWLQAGATGDLRTLLDQHPLAP